MPKLDHALRPLVQGRRVLHVGCIGTLNDNPAASYRMHRFLHGLAADLHGIDIYPEGVERMLAEGFDVSVADAETYGTDRPFDAVLVLSVLQFVASPLRILENLRLALRPGGLCVVSVPNVYSADRLQREVFGFGRAKPVQTTGQSSYGETSLFASHNLVGLFQASGYEVRNLFRCHSKNVWSSQSLREGLYNFRSYAPGLLVPMLRPTLVGVAERTDS